MTKFIMKTNFEEAVEQGYKSNELTRIRIKIDPKNPDQSFEGYYIKENEDGNVVVYIPDMEEPTQTISPDSYEAVVDKGLQRVKTIALYYMLKKGIISKRDPDICKLRQLHCVATLEDFLKSKFMGDHDLLEIYRTYIESE